MTIKDMSKQELEQKLDEIITILVKKGLLPALSEKEKKEITQKVANTLMTDPNISLSKEDLKNDTFQKALGLSCMAQLLHMKNPEYKFDYSMLFKSQLNITPKELQKELSLLFTNALKLSPAYKDKKPEEKAALEAELNLLAKDMSALKKDSNEPLLENNHVMGFVMAGLDMLSEQRRSLYGVDTHTPGSIFIPVREIPFGEQMGLLDLANSGESFMGKRDEAAPVPDPLGIHMGALINFLTDGNTTAYEQYLMNNKVIPSAEPEPAKLSPFNTKPTPFNQ